LRFEKPKQFGSWNGTLNATEYGTLLGIDKKNQYRELKIATKFLLKYFNSKVIITPINMFSFNV
jgi:hypothetical protein